MNRNLVLLIAAIVCFILGAVAAGSDDGEVVFAALVWLGIGSAAFAAAHLPG